MTDRDATNLVNLLRDNWDSIPWTQGRYDLFVKAILPLPYPLTARVVGELVKHARYRIVVSDIVNRVEALMAHDETKRIAAEERKRLIGPRDPTVRSILRSAIERLERKAKAHGLGRRNPFEPSAPASSMTPQQVAARRAELRRQARALGA